MQTARWEEAPLERLSDRIERRVVWGQQATLARFSLAKGAHVSRHHHPAEQFTCVMEGAIRLELAGRELVLRAGDMLVIPPNLDHEAWVLEDTVVWDFFAPPRDDWKAGKDQYLTAER